MCDVQCVWCSEGGVSYAAVECDVEKNKQEKGGIGGLVGKIQKFLDVIWREFSMKDMDKRFKNRRSGGWVEGCRVGYKRVDYFQKEIEEKIRKNDFFLKCQGWLGDICF